MNISCGGKEKTNEESSVLEPADVVFFFSVLEIFVPINDELCTSFSLTKGILM